MIKQPSAVRERVLFEVDRMLKTTHSFVTFLPETEMDVLTALQHPQRFDLMNELADLMLKRFGHSCEDKTHRAVSKQKKVLRGTNTYDNSNDRRRRKATEVSP